MSHHSKKTGSAKGWLFAISLPAIILLFSIFSFSTKKYASDIWNQLGLTQEKGIENIKQSFLQGYLYSYGAQSAKKIVNGEKAAVAKDLLTYTKQYLGTEDFKKEYEKSRQGTKPMEPWKKTAKTKEEIRKEKIAEVEKSIAGIEKNMPKLTPEVKKVMEPLLESQKNTLKDYKDPNSEMIEMMAEGEKMSVETDWKNYKEQVKRWEEEYPANPNIFIKRRLQQYLDIAATVDFSAAVKDVNGKKIFVNSTYEYKPADWKKVYRAGKEVNDVVKPFVTSWIKDLQ
jgi:hypothetical protein